LFACIKNITCKVIKYGGEMPTKGGNCDKRRESGNQETRIKKKKDRHVELVSTPHMVSMRLASTTARRVFG
jgi:hypothetical protein